MISSTKDKIAKIHTILEEGMYVSAKTLAGNLHVSTSTIYRLVSIMRMKLMIPVQRTKQGYCLSEFCTKNDDVWLMRTLNGRRTSDTMLLNTCQSAIVKRWKGVEEKKIKSICSSLTTNVDKLKNNTKILLHASGKV